MLTKMFLTIMIVMMTPGNLYDNHAVDNDHAIDDKNAIDDENDALMTNMPMTKMFLMIMMVMMTCWPATYSMVSW